MRVLLAGGEVGRKAEDLDELDALDLADDPVELALVQRAPELPALAEAVGRAADKRIQVAVRRVADVLLDALQVGVDRGLEVHDDADAVELDGKELEAHPDHAPLVEVLGDLGQERLVGEALVRIAKETGVVAMAGHVRRFNPSHQYVHKKIQRGELKIQQMDVEIDFFRRKNMNAAGQPRRLDRPPVVASRGAYHRFVSVPDRRDHLRLLCGPGADPSAAWHRHGHGHRRQGPLRRHSDAIVVVQ